jgi:hypothetical protein
MTNGIVCPFCDEPAVIKKSSNTKYSWPTYTTTAIYAYACPKGHLQSAWYSSAEDAFKAWLRLVKMTEQEDKS